MDEEMKERIERMAESTWQSIGGDILSALEEAGEEAEMPRDHVIEVVCDADHMLTFGRDKEAYAVWKELPTYEEKIAAVEGAFPYHQYGW